MNRPGCGQAYLLLAVAVLLCCGCGASLRRHAERASTASARTEVAEALGTLERLRAEGWVTRMQSGECRRTYHRAGEVVLESGDVIGDIAGVTEENTPPECRAALDASRMRRESAPGWPTRTRQARSTRSPRRWRS